MTQKFAGKTVLVTGGNSGIGLATAKHFVAEGATVFVTGRRQEQLDRAVAGMGEAATGVQGDITSQADLDRLFALIELQAGHLDVVIANAGAARFAQLGDYTEEIFDAVMGLNLKGTAFTVQKALCR